MQHWKEHTLILFLFAFKTARTRLTVSALAFSWMAVARVMAVRSTTSWCPVAPARAELFPFFRRFDSTTITSDPPSDDVDDVRWLPAPPEVNDVGIRLTGTDTDTGADSATRGRLGAVVVDNDVEEDGEGYATTGDREAIYIWGFLFV